LGAAAATAALSLAITDSAVSAEPLGARAGQR
jgi:hypothetical protein